MSKDQPFILDFSTTAAKSLNPAVLAPGNTACVHSDMPVINVNSIGDKTSVSTTEVNRKLNFLFGLTVLSIIH